MIDDIYKNINLTIIKKGKKYTYGEILYEGVNKIFDHLNLKDKKFLDIGSGIGKIVIQLSLKYPLLLSHGIELCKERYLISNIVKNKIKNKDIKNKIEFYNKNIFEYHSLDYDIIFFSNLCFSEFENEIIGNILSKNKYTILISLKKIKNLNKFLKYYIFDIKTSWSDNKTVYYYYIQNT